MSDIHRKDEAVLKIATWNLNWPRPSSVRNAAILEILKKVDADILVLTETNCVIHPGEEYMALSSEPLPDPKPYDYKTGDHEVTIWSKQHMTAIPIKESSTSVCGKLKLPEVELTVYGTVIGVLGVKKGFLNDVAKQTNDWKLLSTSSGDICIAGDFNVCWSGKHFPKLGQGEISGCLDKIGLQNLTSEIDGNIDHIAISKSFTKTAECKWNLDKKLSDHMGVSITVRRDLAK